MRWSRRFFRILLLAYPSRIRKDRGADMWLTFERHLRDARRTGRIAVVDLWRREVIALMHGGRRARISSHKQRRTYRQSVRLGRPNIFSRTRMSWLDFKLGFRMLIKYRG